MLEKLLVVVCSQSVLLDLWLPVLDASLEPRRTHVLLSHTDFYPSLLPLFSSLLVSSHLLLLPLLVKLLPKVLLALEPLLLEENQLKPEKISH